MTPGSRALGRRDREHEGPRWAGDGHDGGTEGQDSCGVTHAGEGVEGEVTRHRSGKVCQTDDKTAFECITGAAAATSGWSLSGAEDHVLTNGLGRRPGSASSCPLEVAGSHWGGGKKRQGIKVHTMSGGNGSDSEKRTREKRQEAQGGKPVILIEWPGEGSLGRWPSSGVLKEARKKQPRQQEQQGRGAGAGASWRVPSR